MTEKKYGYDELKDMLQQTVHSKCFNNAIAYKKRITITEFLAIVGSEMKEQEKFCSQG